MNKTTLTTLTLAMLSLSLTFAAGCGGPTDEEEKEQTVIVVRKAQMTITRSDLQLIAHVWLDTNENASCDDAELLSADDSRVLEVLSTISDPLTISENCPTN